MKRIIGVVVIFILIASLGTFSLYQLYETKSTVLVLLEQSEEYMQKDDFDSAKQVADKLFGFFKQKETSLRLFVRRNEVGIIADYLAELIAFAEQKDKALFFGVSHKTKNTIEHLWECEIPNFNNLL